MSRRTHSRPRRPRRKSSGKPGIAAGRAPADTSAAAWDAQLAMLRRLGGAKRVAIALGLTGMAREASRAGIGARHPEYEDGEVRRAFFRMLHGDDATRCVWPDLELLEP